MRKEIMGVWKFVICVMVIMFIYLTMGDPMVVRATVQGVVTNGVVNRADGTLAYYTDGKINKSVNGLVYIEDLQKWIYFTNGIMNTEVYEFVYYDGRYFLVANGEVANLTGLVLYNDSWYYLANGQLIDDYEGLTLYDGEWFYVRDGKLATDISGICDYDGECFLVAEGHLLTDYSGLYQSGEEFWVLVVEGRWQQEYIGIVQYNGSQFWIYDGILNSGSLGDRKVRYKDKIYILHKGQVMTGWENVPDAEVYGYKIGDCMTHSYDGSKYIYIGNDIWEDEMGCHWSTYTNFSKPEQECEYGRLTWFLIL